ncbi:MAG: hypothetical protein KTR21_02645 [Rhodobacteraceae bacterium]|nr:hypothetical protein [Paracoccaceae bacterium]
MTFSSYEFILIFLPLCYLGFLAVHRGFGWAGVYPYLAAMSLLFYAMFSATLTLVLVGSVLVNFALGRLIVQLRESGQATGWFTAGAVGANLAMLGYAKYANFFIDITNSASGAGFSHIDLIVPVGVSFFTFTQIGFLLEANSGQVGRVPFSRYALFATFFPCVTAGPILLQREIFGQMEEKQGPAYSTVALSIGLTIFAMGLFKKVILADSIAPYADTAFDGVAAGATIGVLEAWAGALAYTFQLYFDFSGYTDMAIGLGYIFGLKLPLNFNSPFRATSISEFWRRWHMTMTRFFTTYLYTPLAVRGTRTAMQAGYSPVQRWLIASAIPVVFTFFIAGIWHGAGWTFVVYGLIHGAALAVNHGWRQFKGADLGPQVGWVLTMSVVVTGLVVFRAPDMQVAGTIIASMWGYEFFGEALRGEWSGAVLVVNGAVAADYLGDRVKLDLQSAFLLIAAYGGLVLSAPNTQEVLRNYWVSCDPQPEEDQDTAWLRWRPNLAWGMAAGLVFVIALSSMGDHSHFLYYKF